jgi:hypothetical protein
LDFVSSFIADNRGRYSGNELVLAFPSGALQTAGTFKLLMGAERGSRGKLLTVISGFACQ